MPQVKKTVSVTKSTRINKIVFYNVITVIEMIGEELEDKSHSWNIAIFSKENVDFLGNY